MLVTIKCPSCGAPVKMISGKTNKCEFCGSTFVNEPAPIKYNIKDKALIEDADYYFNCFINALLIDDLHTASINIKQLALFNAHDTRYQDGKKLIEVITSIKRLSENTYYEEDDNVGVIDISLFWKPVKMGGEFGGTTYEFYDESFSNLMSSLTEYGRNLLGDEYFDKYINLIRENFKEQVERSRERYTNYIASCEEEKIKKHKDNIFIICYSIMKYGGILLILYLAFKDL